MHNKSIASTVRFWVSESKNPRNDGWVQLHYKNKLNEIFSIIKPHKNNDYLNEDYKDEEYNLPHINDIIETA